MSEKNLEITQKAWDEVVAMTAQQGMLIERLVQQMHQITLAVKVLSKTIETEKPEEV